MVKIMVGIMYCRKSNCAEKIRWSEVIDNHHVIGLQYLPTEVQVTALSYENFQNMSLPPQKDCPLVRNSLNPPSHWPTPGFVLWTSVLLQDSSQTQN